MITMKSIEVHWGVRIASITLLFGGLAMITAAVVVDRICWSAPGFGMKQGVLMLLGFVVFLIGITLPRITTRWRKMVAPTIVALIICAFALGYSAGELNLTTHAKNLFADILNFQPTPVTETSDAVIELELRGYHLAGDPQQYDTELSGGFTYSFERIPVNETALILVDVWKWHPNDGHLERAQKTIPNISEVLQAARENNMLIVHAPAGRAIADMVSPLPGEIVLDSSNEISDDKELHQILQRYNIKTLFYVGFATNMCVLRRSYGMERMHSLGYRVILLRDCTTGIEFHDTLEGLWATRVAIRYVECDLGYTTTAQDFMEGFTKQ